LEQAPHQEEEEIMPRLPIAPAFDRSSNTRRGMRLALAVGLGTLALGTAAGAFAAAAKLPSQVAVVRHVDTAKAIAPSALHAKDLFTNPTAAPDEVVADAALAAVAAAPMAPAGSETEGTKSTEDHHSVPPRSDDSSSEHPPSTAPAKPKPKSSPSPEPSQTPEPTSSPHD
jgi:hypothetical protein